MYSDRPGLDFSTASICTGGAGVLNAYRREPTNIHADLTEHPLRRGSSLCRVCERDLEPVRLIGGQFRRDGDAATGCPAPTAAASSGLNEQNSGVGSQSSLTQH